MCRERAAPNGSRIVLVLWLLSLGFSANAAWADTLFEDNFDTNPCGRWQIYYGDCSTDAGCTVYYYTGAQDACGSTWGYAYREYDGDRCMVNTSFATDGYTNLQLRFWYKNDSGASISVAVKQGGAWTGELTEVGTASSWTQKHVNLSGVITGVRFKLKGSSGQTRRLDCVSITGDPDCSPAVEITQHPSDLAVYPGQQAVFTVAATGSNLTYQWQKNGGDLSDGGDISGATTDTLQIASAEAADSGDYRCVVTGDCGTVTSNAATLTVGYEVVLFEETFSTNPFSGGRWAVYKDGEPRPDTVNYHSSGGACGSPAGYVERHYDGHRDVVYEGSPFTTAGYENLKLTFWYKNDSGASVQAYVLRNGGWVSAATGGTAGSWTKSETDLTGTITGIYFKLNGGSDDYRRLDCVSIVGEPACSPAVTITQHPSDLGACPGDTVIFSVVATGSNLTYQWQKDGGNLSDGGDVSGATTPTLQIANAESADNGDYRCVVTGDCGTVVSNAAMLSVSAVPTITQQPESQDECLGNTATFTVDVVGAGTMTYQWQKDGGDISGATMATLQIADVEPADGGIYRCVVTDDCGTTASNDAALTVLTDCLNVSPSGHYVTYTGQPLLFAGDSGTQCATQNSNLDHREWIDDCAARGIRAIHVWSFLGARQKQDASVIENRWGYVYPCVTPWARHTSGPLANDQLYQWNLQAYDDGPDGDLTHYWPRMRDMCSYAKSKDMLVGYTVFTGWIKGNHDAWEYHPFNAENGGHLTNNLPDGVTIATPGTEVWQQTWSGGWSNAQKTQWVWERLAIKAIDDLGQFGNVFFVFFDEHSYDEGNMGDHFRDFFQNRGQIWMDWSNRRSTVDLVMSSTFGGDDKNSNAVSGFNAAPTKPYFFLEGEPYMGDGVRTAIWTFTTGGGSYFFHADAGQETDRTGIMGYDPYVPGGDKGTYKRDWLGFASRLFNEHVYDLDTMAPHNELSDSGTYCLADPGREYVVYSRIGSSTTFNVNLSAAAGQTLNCRFYNPRNGNFQSTFQRAGGGTESFTKPNSDDWALHIVLPMMTLTLTETNGVWGDVDVQPEPDDPEDMQLPAGTEVTLTAVPVEGKSFKHWQIFHPDHPNDANYATLDANDITTIIMDTDLHVNAVWKCGGVASLLLPLMLGVLGLMALASRRRRRQA